jgi:predicted TIM-barrel fold metal-dependent hydrolase
MAAPCSGPEKQVTRFVFSADAHVNEPRGFYEERLPAPLRDRALRTERRDGFLVMVGENQEIHRMQLADGNSAQYDNQASEKRVGGFDIELRLKDMARDGVDAELVFPQLGTLVYMLSRELALAHVQIYNDWCIGHFKSHPETFVPVAALPAADPAETLAEVKRVAALGYRAAMMPVETPAEAPGYNSDKWDPVWDAVQTARLPICLHVSTGSKPIQMRGAGAAVMNYVRLGLKAQDAVGLFVCGGALDRFPGLNIVTVEAGASWLIGMAEHMDEAYKQHYHYVRPKLSMLPSELMRRQVKATFQYDRAAVLARATTGYECLLFATDYPHMEGTFPNTRKVIDDLFRGVDIPEAEKAAILGGNAAQLFRLRAQA